MVPLGLTGLCAVLFVVGLAFFMFKVSRKVAGWCFLLAGLSGAGAIGTAKGNIAGAVLDGSQALMASTLGAGVALAAVAFMSIYLYARLLKGSGGGVITMAVAYMYPAALTAVGLGTLVNLVGTSLTSANSAFGALISGFGG